MHDVDLVPTDLLRPLRYASCSQALKEKKKKGDALYYVMTQAQSIYTLCNYGVVYTRIQSIEKEKERERKREEKRNTLTERGSGTGWQNVRSG